MEETRTLEERIMYGAIIEFKERGVKFTMDMLAKQVGISKRTLYETITSKREAVEFVIDRTFEDVHHQQAIVLENDQLSTVEKLEQLFTIIPQFGQVMDYRRIEEIRLVYPKLYEKVVEGLENDWEPALELLKQGMKEGVLREKNLDMIRFLLVQVYEQLINGKQLIERNISYEDAMKEIIDIIFKGLLENNYK